LPIREQVESYKFEGYPEHNGLMAAGLILRDMRRRELHQINEDWWQEKSSLDVSRSIITPLCIMEEQLWL
jgi:hypothetical protein